ncbi:hypothetical protein K0M31_017020 [Melipona bicolor]|uniref:Uncharacterized protein n=1 Tax=Melipona bicolor TaxID=60889 RepID=A0AA40FDQ7_9HYME|nr:hypothetical protein K0M31_017020 [Melipona bicolor]
MHQVNFLSYRISKLYPRALLHSPTGLNNVRAPKSWLRISPPLTPGALEAGATYHGVVTRGARKGQDDDDNDDNDDNDDDDDDDDDDGDERQRRCQ